jgi:plasmid stabilization system protein ParE
VRVRLTAAASSDLQDIGDWIAQDSRRRAASFTDELVARSRAIGSRPWAYPVVMTVQDRAVRRAVQLSGTL